MPRKFDHLVLCVSDLEAAKKRFRSFGFTLTPPADHPFGTRNRLALLDDGFLELLAIGNADAIPAAAPGEFSFGAHNQAFLAQGEGMSMLALQGSDSRADAREFAARGLGGYAPFDFSRAARLTDGRTACVAFSLAFATDAGLPRLAFFTCHHRQPRDLLWEPAYQQHANGAKRIVEVVLAAADPQAHRSFFERLIDTQAKASPGMLSIGAADSRITLLDQGRLAERFPECRDGSDAPRVVAYRVIVADLGAVERHLRESGVACRSDGRTVVVAPTTAFGVAIEFASAGE